MARRYATLMLASRLQREIDQLFREIGQAADALETSGWQPAIDVFETAKAVFVLVELPGIPAGDLELHVEGNLLTLRGRKQPTQTPPQHARFQMVESGHGAFERKLRVETAVNSHKAEATLRDGLLTIVLPRVADRRQESRKVTVRDD